MAKAKAQEPATETFVETAQDLNFADPEPEPTPRGRDVQGDMEVIRTQRAKARAARGPQVRKRVVTNYHDAERLHNLVTGKVPGDTQQFRDSTGRTIRGSEVKFPELATAAELVDMEENGLLPNPEHYATGSTATLDDVEPDEAV